MHRAPPHVAALTALLAAIAPIAPVARVAAVAALGLGLGACAKSKANESPAVASAEGGAAPARTAQPLLCNDGFHRRGEHWKIDCNPCRCGADGDIVCAQFPCPSSAPAPAPAPALADAGPRDAAR